MAKKATRKPVRAKGQRGGATIASKGAVTQGDKKSARGGNAGANQGGAPRGASRLEPSTLKKGTGRVSGKRQHTKKKNTGQ